MIDYPSISSSKMLYNQVASLLLYQSIFNNSVGEALLILLQTLHQEENHSNSRQVTAVDCLVAYGNWFKKLAENQESWGDYLVNQILLNENPFSLQVQTQSLEKLPISLIEAVKNDLQILENLYNCSPEKISQWLQISAQTAHIPIVWEEKSHQQTFLNKSANWQEKIDKLALHYQKKGTGIFAEYQAFRWRKGELEGVKSPDPIKIEEIVGYQWQKEALIKNTEFLLAGYRSLCVLVYGSRGSGKSSLIKSLVNKYSEQGLRLIEVTKSEFQDLPIILEKLGNSHQKFIIFVDDLSFQEEDESFKGFKVVLEGGIIARPANVVVYATSNRRHLVREDHGDRPRPSEEEIHPWDTVQEKLSFSDRFGLTLTFEPLNQEDYLEIVRHLAKQAKINPLEDSLEFKAKQWATRNNGRSGRTARQFIDFLAGELATAEKLNS